MPSHILVWVRILSSRVVLPKALFCPYIGPFEPSMISQSASTQYFVRQGGENGDCTYGLVILRNRVICVKQMCSSEIWRDSKRAYHVWAEDQESAVRIRPLPAV